jgi:DNA polymerase-3 subunit alpha
MAHLPFVHLHVRSEYSFLRSTLRVRDIARLAAALNLPAVALTDRMNLHGAVAFHDACARQGIKPLLGAEIAVTPLAPLAVVDPYRPPVFDLVLLAEDLTGYARLCELLTRIHLQAGAASPAASPAWLEELAGHWVVLSGGMQGEIAQMLLAGNARSARAAAETLAHIAGPGRFYLELQWHETQDERVVLPQLMELARGLNVPVVATNQCAYARAEEARAVELLRRIEANQPIQSLEDLTPVSTHYYVRSHEEMTAAFRAAPEAVANTMAIMERCAVELPLGSGHLLPKFETPDGSPGRAYLQRLCDEGLRARYTGWDTPAAPAPPALTKKKRREVSARLATELDTIAHMGFVSYFLIVADFVSYARRQGIPVGPGRGSAAGSLVSFLLGITDVDPLEYGLLFERFLNPARKKMPDIDMDFCERRRNEVIAYVRQRYGAEFVAQIGSFSTLRYKAALRDTCKALAIGEAVCDKICALVAAHERAHDKGRSGALRDALAHCEPLRDLYLHDAQAKTALDLAVMIEDLPRNLSTHAAGVVIAPVPLRTLTPLTRGAGDEVVTQCDMFAVERLGLLKMDFLGLTTLTILDDARASIRATRGTELVFTELPLDDAATFALLQRGDVLGVFQLETSAGMRRLLCDLHPASIHDLIAVLALYRPGALHAADDFVARMHGRAPVTYPHPALEPILKETYGIMIYQEQVMQCLHKLAGYSLADADTFRQIMSKKLVAHVNAERGKFMARARDKGMDAAVAEELFELVARFANYGFNKSHATAYAMVAYWTAYVKANYPEEFFAALLNSRADAAAQVQACQTNCRALGVTVRGPDVNHSAAAFAVEREAGATRPVIRYGLDAVRNVGPAAAAGLCAERAAGGPFASLDDLCRRGRARTVTRKTIEALVKAGACDGFGVPRQRMALLVDDITAGWERATESALQRSFFETYDDQASTAHGGGAQLGEVHEWDLLTKLAFEKEALGVYVSGHPLDACAQLWRACVTADARRTGYQAADEDEARAEQLLDAAPAAVIMGGLVLASDWRMSKRGKAYGVISLEDFYGAFDALLWSDMIEQARPRLVANQIVFLRGTLRESFGRISLSVMALATRDELVRAWLSALRLTLSAAQAAPAMLARIAAIVKQYPGATAVELQLPGRDAAAPARTVAARTRVAVTEDLLRLLVELLGEDAVHCVC